MIGTEAYSFQSAWGNFLDGLVVFLIGVSMVFITLVLLIVVIKLMGYLTKEKVAEVVKVEEENIVVCEDEFIEKNEVELIAVITAALAASLEVTTDQLVVKSLRKINR